jgi:hypothetical protein
MLTAAVSDLSTVLGGHNRGDTFGPYILAEKIPASVPADRILQVGCALEDNEVRIVAPVLENRAPACPQAR